MQKAKFMMGLGIGIIWGSLLLQLVYSFQKLENAVPLNEEASSALDAGTAETITEQQLLKAAESLQYKVYPAAEVLYSQEQLDEAVNQALEEAKQYSKVLFVINPGMRPNDVAKILISLELIEDGEAFIQMIRQKALTTRIVSGTYEFEGEPSMEEILEAITY